MNLLDWLALRQEVKVATKERSHACKTCEVLQRELDRAHLKNERLLDELLKPEFAPQVAAPAPQVVRPELKQVMPLAGNWERQRAILEARDAEEFARKQALKKQEEIEKLARANSVDELEKELEINNA